MKSLQYYIQATYLLVIFFFFPPLNNSVLSQELPKLTEGEAKQEPLMLRKGESKDMVNFIIHLYRSNLLNFTEKYEKYYLNETPEQLENLFRDEVLNSLTAVELLNWELPRFISSGNRDLVVNEHNLPYISDEQIKDDLERSGKNNEYINKRYGFTLSNDIKKECVDVLSKEHFYIKKVDDNYVIGVSVIPTDKITNGVDEYLEDEDADTLEYNDQSNKIRKMFNEDKVKTNCVRCHVEIIANKNKKDQHLEEDTGLLADNYESYNLDALNGVFLFEVPIKK